MTKNYQLVSGASSIFLFSYVYGVSNNKTQFFFTGRIWQMYR